MGRHRKKRAVVPVRTGLLGASAAMAVGAVAVASGLLPGGDTYKVGGGPSGEQIRTGVPELQTQGEASATPTGRASVSPSRSAERTQAPSRTPSAKPSPTAAKPSPTATKPSSTPTKAKTKAPEPEPAKTQARPSSAAPSRTAAAPTPRRTVEQQPSASRLAGKEATAEAAVLSLVNTERAKVGCSPVRPDAGLASLAGAFSADMAARNFFAHTDPDGDSPWDRAAQAGVPGLAAENIARGQTDAQAVMDSWMNSDGHRANILNCDYTKLGVGVHFADGGPWWTQDFGF
ncbi:CAP domain-containing protein [Streptomyces sp. NRRL S-118]|uniref:CAP domain-containing protein n=1 Tax=Streptomyces sp. NRRL S-118 TaxID=1463881 RepID=UPI0004C4EFD6|nr:CAP domain-containing protein [Streptomyces sp. NRRL S-118]